MTIKEIVDALDAEVLWSDKDDAYPIQMGCGSDLMSDVLSFTKAGSLLLTGLTTLQVVYTAEMADIRAICFVRGKSPQEETVALAKTRGVILLRTRLPMFESCGRLYLLGLKGCSEP